MVFFTCNQCGQSVKKAQVEAHCNFQCRNCESLSCIDCGKEFWGDEYKEHTKCLTEDQKYGGKNYQPKPSSNKGEIKQEKWIEHIKNVISTKKLSGTLARLLEQIVEFPNIPRKKLKFENFLKNSIKIRNPNLIAEAWEIFAQSTMNESKSTSAESPAVNGINGAGKRPSESTDNTPSKKACVNGTQAKSPGNESNNFKWIEVIERILQQNAQNSLPIFELRRQVLAEYKACVKNPSVSKEDLKRQFKDVISNSDIFVLNKTS